MDVTETPTTPNYSKVYVVVIKLVDGDETAIVQRGPSL